jgi:hypothetical protein
MVKSDNVFVAVISAYQYCIRILYNRPTWSCAHMYAHMYA